MASEGIEMEHREDWLSNNNKSIIIANRCSKLVQR